MLLENTMIRLHQQIRSTAATPKAGPKIGFVSKNKPIEAGSVVSRAQFAQFAQSTIALRPRTVTAHRNQPGPTPIGFVSKYATITGIDGMSPTSLGRRHRPFVSRKRRSRLEALCPVHNLHNRRSLFGLGPSQRIPAKAHSNWLRFENRRSRLESCAPCTICTIDDRSSASDRRSESNNSQGPLQLA